MEKALKSRAFILALIVLALVGALGVWAKSACLISPNDFYCYREATARVLAKDGVDAALAYVGLKVSPKTGYAFAHFILHDVGEYAYGTTGDLDEALRYLERYRQEVSRQRALLELDGFIHGVVSSHLLARGEPGNYSSTLDEVCANWHQYSKIAGDEFGCHHALGHGLVHASANRILPALEACRATNTREAREGCYYGAFMELTFLYLPEYHPGAPRPDSENGSLGVLCAELDEDARPHCMHFVGQSYLHAHPEEYKGAFATCATLGEFATTCAKRLGQVTVTNYAQDEHEAKAFCKKHAGVLEDACFDSAVKAIGLGFGRESDSLF